MSTDIFNVELKSDWELHNLSRPEKEIQKKAIVVQAEKVTELMGGKVKVNSHTQHMIDQGFDDDYGQHREFLLFSVADVYASHFTKLAIEQMKAIDSNKDKIKAELKKLVGLQSGAILADDVIAYRKDREESMVKDRMTLYATPEAERELRKKYGIPTMEERKQNSTIQVA